MIESADLFVYIAVGATAQLVDGALGMAYGVTSAGILISLGIPPVQASAGVHYAETFTIGASGLSHLWAGNVHCKLFWALVITGATGVLIGSQWLIRLPEPWIRVALIPYLLLISVLLLLRALPGKVTHYHARIPRLTPPLGFIAGLVDAIGGGGWSAITVTTLMAHGMKPRYVIGSVHLAKFVVSILASISFLLTVGIMDEAMVIIGLIVGGVIAAPFGALLIRHLSPRLAILLAGVTVLTLSMYNAITLLR